MKADISHNKSGSSWTSFYAWLGALPNMSDDRIEVLKRLKVSPASAKEVAEEWSVGFNTISGRFSELKKMGLIRGTGVCRHGSQVMCLVEQAEATAAQDKSGDTIGSPASQQAPINAPNAKFSTKNSEKPIVVGKIAVKPLSPSQVHKELKALCDTWNSARYDEMSEDAYEQARKAIFERGRAWGKSQ